MHHKLINLVVLVVLELFQLSLVQVYIMQVAVAAEHMIHQFLLQVEQEAVVPVAEMVALMDHRGLLTPAAAEGVLAVLTALAELLQAARAVLV
jgi:hypothetical protein